MNLDISKISCLGTTFNTQNGVWHPHFEHPCLESRQNVLPPALPLSHLCQTWKVHKPKCNDNNSWGFIYIAPSSDLSLLTLNLSFKVILRRFELRKSGVRMLHFSKNWWKFIQIQQHYIIMALKLRQIPFVLHVYFYRSAGSDWNETMRVSLCVVTTLRVLEWRFLTSHVMLLGRCLVRMRHSEIISRLPSIANKQTHNKTKKYTQHIQMTFVCSHVLDGIEFFTWID